MFSAIGNDSNEKHQQLWKIVVLAAGPAAVVGFTAGLIVLLTILIRNRRRLKHLCYGGMLSMYSYKLCYGRFYALFLCTFCS